MSPITITILALAFFALNYGSYLYGLREGKKQAYGDLDGDGESFTRKDLGRFQSEANKRGTLRKK